MQKNRGSISTNLIVDDQSVKDFLDITGRYVREVNNNAINVIREDLRASTLTRKRYKEILNTSKFYAKESNSYADKFFDQWPYSITASCHLALEIFLDQSKLVKKEFTSDDIKCIKDRLEFLDNVSFPCVGFYVSGIRPLHFNDNEFRVPNISIWLPHAPIKWGFNKPCSAYVYAVAPDEWKVIFKYADNSNKVVEKTVEDSYDSNVCSPGEYYNDVVLNKDVNLDNVNNDVLSRDKLEEWERRFEVPKGTLDEILNCIYNTLQDVYE